jgi:hypothetical protein
MAWRPQTPEGLRQQVDSALEYALERAIAERPAKPLLLVAAKLRMWDEAVNGSWPLRKRSEAVFRRADGDGSGQLDLAELRELQHAAADAFLRAHDGDNNCTINMAEWLIHMHECCTSSQVAASALLDLFEARLDGGRSTCTGATPPRVA